MLLLSVVVPIFNEEKIIFSELENFTKCLSKFIDDNDWGFVIVNNGSTDNSQNEIEKILKFKKYSKCIFVEKPDYGLALRSGINSSNARFCHIINVEQWDIDFLKWSLENRKEYDLILGSKRADPTLNLQSNFRKFLSWGLNSILSLLFETVSIDTHGPKFLNMNRMKQIIEETKLNRGQFDTEFSLRAQREGLWIAEAPIKYHEKRRQKNFMIAKIYRNIFDLLKLRKILKNVKYKSNVNFRRFSYFDIKNINK